MSPNLRKIYLHINLTEIIKFIEKPTFFNRNSVPRKGVVMIGGEEKGRAIESCRLRPPKILTDSNQNKSFRHLRAVFCCDLSRYQ